MSMMPEVLRPYCAGKVPVIRLKELAKRGLRPWPKKLNPVGRGIPLIRNSAGCISLRI